MSLRYIETEDDPLDRALIGEADPAGVSAQRDGARAPFSLVIIVLANFLPVETSLMLGGLRLPAARLLLLLLAPYLCFRLSRKITEGRYRFVASDAFVLLAGCWMLFGSIVGIGVADALNHAGPEILEFCFAYLATRALLSAPGQAFSLINVLCIATAVIGLIAVLDSATDSFITHDVANRLTGFGKDVVGRPDYRLGIRRAAGPLEHPILLGATCTIGLLCGLGLPLRGRVFAIVGCAAGLAVAVSAAPLQATVIGLCMMAYDRVFHRFQRRWLLLLALLACVLTLSFVLLGSPLGFVNEYLIFDPESGFSRQFEWASVGEYVTSSPWIGIGFGWTEIAESIDAFASIDSVWLGKALIYGIPCSVLIALSFVGSGPPSANGPGVDLEPNDARVATILGIVMWLFIGLGFTVYFWGSFWVLSALLAGIRAHLSELGRLGAEDRDYAA